MQDQWDYTRLKRSPCRQFGWPATGDFVIAAHNYTSHFKQLSKLEPGDAVQFEDMNGRVYAVSYTHLDVYKRQAEGGGQYEQSQQALRPVAPAL